MFIAYLNAARGDVPALPHSVTHEVKRITERLDFCHGKVGEFRSTGPVMSRVLHNEFSACVRYRSTRIGPDRTCVQKRT